LYVEILPNVPKITGTYHYQVSDSLRSQLRFGHLVVVPFGKRLVQGIVVALGTVPPSDITNYKYVESILDPNPVLTKNQLDLAWWLSKRYYTNLIDCVMMMLPQGLSQRVDYIYELADDSLSIRTQSQIQIVALLREQGPLLGRRLGKMLQLRNWKPVIERLVNRGVVKKTEVLKSPNIRPKNTTMVRLSAGINDPELIEEKLSKHLSVHSRRIGVLQFLAGNGRLADKKRVYAETGANLADLRSLTERGHVSLEKVETIRDSLSGLDVSAVEPPKLVKGQDEAWSTVKKAFVLSAPKPILLHGVTGSGKTEIYMRAVTEALRQGLQAIVLVPEIALTAQTVRRFSERFPGRVGLLHSRLSVGERYDTWRRSRSGTLDVLVGARSALFAPLPHIGLIVVDEEHEEAYRQDPPVQPPYYNARDAAVEYARQLRAVCILGSATPDLTSMTFANKRDFVKVTLPNRIMGHTEQLTRQSSKLGVRSTYKSIDNNNSKAQFIKLPDVEIVDMRHELRSGNRSMFSRSLKESLAKVFQAQQQAILFINRRGYASYVFCRDCGHTLECPRCNIPFTYHSTQNTLVCHHCNSRCRSKTSCPICSSDRIKHFGVGTESVESEVQRYFPKVRTLRWDRDVTQKVGSHDKILQRFSERDADVLIGTQMIAKGLDLPLVTLVGAVSCDVGLTLPDYRASERTFQVLTQVAGRAGRGILGGHAIMQTYMPEHHAIVSAAAHDYNGFYNQELQLRRHHRYPPFGKIARLVGINISASRIESDAQSVAADIRGRIQKHRANSTDVIGPAPCFFSRTRGKYRWHVILRGPDPAELANIALPNGWRLEVDPLSLL
jgi:primosomal protein N' (replication factor Y)